MPLPTLRLLLASALLAAPALTVAAPKACRAHSPAHRVALLELYTSEGCSSCPPADRWVAGLRDAGFAPDRVVPLALHVDYWNNLGWEDPYAQAAFTQRQRRYARLHRSSTVYTPQLVLGGRDFRGWHRGGLGKDLEAINSRTAGAAIEASVAVSDARSLKVSARARPQAPVPADSIELYLAIYERRITRDIGAGENRGRRLLHDYVARQVLGPVRPDDQAVMGIEDKVVLGADWKRADLGLVAFVQDRRNGEVLQALDLPLCENAK